MASTEKVLIQNKKDLLWITLPDSITITHLWDIQNRIKNQMSSAIERVALDLSNLNTMTSISVSLLMKIRSLADKANCPLSLVNVSQTCLSQIELMDLDDQFDIYKNEKDIFIQDN